jgi:hypothetical protein
MTRLTMLLIAAALVTPGVAFAAPSRGLRAPARDGGEIIAAPGTTAAASALDRHGIDQAAAQQRRAPMPAAADGDGLSWAVAISTAMALMLSAGALGVYAGRMIRPRLGA